MSPAGHPADWGFRPVLFEAGGVAVRSYEAFVLLGIAAAAFCFWLQSRKEHAMGDQAVYLVMAALVGGVLGAKLPVWVLHYREITGAGTAAALLSGRTIVGGLIGGTAAVALTRHRLGMRERSGNLFAPGLALGLGIGRIGCLLGGCCYGTATARPWGVDLGDGVMRHPTQAYEALFAFGLFAWLLAASRRNPAPGALFRAFMLAYFTFRFAVEFVRLEPRPYLGLTLAQVVSLGVIAYYALIARFDRAPPQGEPARRETEEARV